MIKLIIFDLDGVLVYARDLHYHALNRALQQIDEKYVISREEHLSTFDGLPTRKKLAMLTEQKGLPEELHQKIWELKQKETIHEIYRTISPTQHISETLQKLKEDGYQIYVASNSTEHNTYSLLSAARLLQYVDKVYFNTSTEYPKPNPSMYLRAMSDAGACPDETLIVEDSHIGRKAAIQSGAHLFAVSNPDDTQYSAIKKHIDSLTSIPEVKPKWPGGNMNVLIPMAGAGRRFQEKGYALPKPLLDVRGKPMIQVVVENLNMDAHYIFIVQKLHRERYQLDKVFEKLVDRFSIVDVDGITEGAACTTLLAKDLINNSEQLVIANSDQYVEFEPNEFMYSMIGDNVDGGIAVFKSNHPKWSYAKLDDNGLVCEVAEKKPISDLATCGIYYWRYGSDYVKYAERMIEKNLRHNGEFYVCPVYNQAIEDGKKVKVYRVKRMWGLGTPEDYEAFLKAHEKE